MYALSFDMTIADLQEHYGNPYHGAYFEIKRTLVKHGFYWVQGSTYMTNNQDMTTLFRAIEALKKIDWFSKSVRDIRAFRVENWSDFTQFIKE